MFHWHFEVCFQMVFFFFSQIIGFNFYSQCFLFQNIAACLLWGALQWNIYLPQSMKIICFKAWNHIFPWKQPTLSNKLYCNILHVLVVVILSGFMIPSNDIISDQCTIYGVFFLAGPPHFQYRKEKRLLANGSCCSMRFFI